MIKKLKKTNKNIVFVLCATNKIYISKKSEYILKPFGYNNNNTEFIYIGLNIDNIPIKYMFNLPIDQIPIQVFDNTIILNEYCPMFIVSDIHIHLEKIFIRGLYNTYIELYKIKELYKNKYNKYYSLLTDGIRKGVFVEYNSNK